MNRSTNFGGIGAGGRESTRSAPHHVVLRGGRLRKTGRGVVTYAPWLGMMCAVAMAAGMALGTGEPAMAQTADPACPETPADTGMYVCSGSGTLSMGINISGNSGDVMVTDTAGFSLKKTADYGLIVYGGGSVVMVDLDGDIELMTSGGRGSYALQATTSTMTTNISVTTDGTVRTDTADAIELFAPSGGSNDLVLTIGGTAVSTDASGNAIEFKGGGSQTLVLNPGASITGAVTADRTDAVLELAATTSQTTGNSFALAGLNDYTNFVDFDKTGAGTWELTGAQGDGMNEFTSADVMAGTLRLNTATFRLALDADTATPTDDRHDMTIAANATLEIMGESVLYGDLVGGMRATLALGSTLGSGVATDKLTVMGGYTTGGSVTLNVDFSDGSADQLEITGMVTMGDEATTVNLRAGAAVTDANALMLPMNPLIDLAVPGSSMDGHFTAGMVYDGVTAHPFTLARDTTSGDWSVTAVNVQTSMSMAGCTVQSTPGTFVCSGAVTETQTVSAGTGQALMVTDTANFAPVVAMGDAIRLRGEAGSTDMTATFMQAINASGTDNTGGGGSDDRGHGIDAEHLGSGPVSITTAAVTAGNRGFDLELAAAAGRADITANGAIMSGGDGFFANHQGTGGLTVTTRSTVTSTAGGGFDVSTSNTNTGGVTITAEGAVTAMASGQNGVRVTNRGSGATTVTANGAVQAGNIGVGVSHEGAGAVSLTTAAVTAGGSGLGLLTMAASGTADITANGAIMSGGDGILANHGGSGRLTINTGSTVTSSSGEGISALTTAANTGGVSITTSGAVSAPASGQMGIFVSNKGSGTTNVTVNGALMAGVDGFVANQDGAAGLTLVTRGTVTSTAARGLAVFTTAANTGGVSITAEGAVSAMATDQTGIFINNRGTGDAVVTVHAAVNAGGRAVFMDGGGAKRLVLRPGAGSFTGAVGAATSDAVLELAGGTGTNGSFALTELADFTNFLDLDKTEDGVWELTGVQGDGENEFNSADVMEGVLRLNAATLRLSDGGNLTIAGGATLDVNGTSTLHGNLVGTSGTDASTLALGSTTSDGDTDDMLTITGSYMTGGSVTLDVDIDMRTADRLVITGGAMRGTEGTEVNLRATGDRNAQTMLAGLVLIEDGDDMSEDEDFTPGMVYIGSDMLPFTLAHDMGDWTVASIGVMPPPAADDCTEDANTGGTWVCSGALSADRMLTAEADEALVITAESNFNLALDRTLTLDGGTSQRFTVRPGAAILGTVAADMNVAARILEFNAAEDTRSSLSSPINYENFTEFEKTGDGVWELQGTMNRGDAFEDAAVMAGTLRLDGAEFRVERCSNTDASNLAMCMTDAEIGKADGLVVAAGATLEVDRRGTIGSHLSDGDGESGFANLINDGGHIAFVMNNMTAPVIGTDPNEDLNCPDAAFRNTCLDVLRVSRYITGGGTLTFNVMLNADDDNTGVMTNTGANTDNADGVDRADLLDIRADASAGAMAVVRGSGGADTVNIRVHGDLGDFSGADEGTANTNEIRLINVAGATVGAADAFTAGFAFVGARRHSFTLTRSGGTGDWLVTAIGAAIPMATRCVEDQSAAGAFVCSGTAVETEGLEAGSGETLMVTDVSDFAATVAAGDAIALYGRPGSTGMAATFTQPIAATGTAGDAGHGVFIDHDGDGTVSLTTAAVTSAGGHGITWGDDDLAAVTGLTVVAGGKITAPEGRGITGSFNGGSVSGAISVTAAEIEAGQAGIQIGSGTGANKTAFSITVTGKVTSTGDKGIAAWHGGTGDLAITAAEVEAEDIGIDANHRGTTGNVVVTVTGAVTGRDGAADDRTPTAIEMTGGAMHRLVLMPGAGAFTGAVTSDKADDTTVLELASTKAATASTTFDLAALSDFTNFDNLDKTGDGVWTLTGAQPTDREFTSAAITQGMLRLSGAEFRPGAAAFEIPAAATLEVDGQSVVHGSLTNGGNLSLFTSDDEATGDRLTIMGDYARGGTVTLNADLADGVADRLVITGSVTGTAATTLNIRATAGSEQTPRLEGVVLIEVNGSSADGDFMPGSILVGGVEHRFTLARSNGDWTVATVAGNPVVPAGPCPEDETVPGRYLCSGTATRTQTFTGRSNEALVVEDAEGFVARVASGNAFTVTGASDGAGTTIDLDGNIRATAGHGIQATINSGSMSRITVGQVEAGMDGVTVAHVSAAAGGGIAVTANGMITAGGAGIRASHMGSGDITVTLGAPVASTDVSDPRAVELTGGGGHRLVLNPGAGAFTGAVTSDRSAGATLELAGMSGESGSTTFDLSQLSGFTNFTDFDKTGNGRWVLTGEQAAGMNEFASVDVEGGTLRFSDAALRLSGGGSLTIASGTTLEAEGASTLHGNLVNGGELALFTAGDDAAGDVLTITGGYTTGGMVTLNVNLDTGAADKLVITGGAAMGSGATTVNLRAEGDLAMPRLMGVVLIEEGDDTSLPAHFTRGMVHHGGDMYPFVLAQASGDWTVTSVNNVTVAAPPALCTGSAGTFECSGAVTETQRLTAASGQALTVTDAPGFSANVATGNAIELRGDAGSTGMTATFTQPVTAATGIGIEAVHQGAGNVAVRATGAVTTGTGAPTGMHGIEISNHLGTGTTAVTAGDITVHDAYRGLHVQDNPDARAMSVTAGGAISAGGAGIFANHLGTGGLTVTLASTGSVVSTGDIGISAATAAVSDSLVIAAGGMIMADGYGIRATHRGSGTLEITAAAVTSAMHTGISFSTTTAGTGATITASGRITAATAVTSGIFGIHRGTGMLSVTAADVDGGNGGTGIAVSAEGNTDAGVSVTTGGTVTGNVGIEAAKSGSGTLTVTTAAVTAIDRAIRASNNNTGGDTIINVEGLVSGATGILADSDGNDRNPVANTGAIVVNIMAGGSVAGTEAAIDLQGGASQRLVLHPDAGSITGAVNAGRSDAVLEFTGDSRDLGSSSFDLSGLSDFTNFGNLIKSGSGTWTLSGEQPADKAFAAATVAGGTLRLADGTSQSPAVLRFETAGGLTIGSGNTLVIDGISEVRGNLASNDGTLELGSLAAAGDTGDMLTITGDYAVGGTVTLNVNIDTGETDRLIIMGDVTGTRAGRVNLRAVGNRAAPQALDGVVLIDVAGASDDGDFTADRVHIGAMMYNFTLAHDAGDWTIASIDGNQVRTTTAGCEEDTGMPGTFACSGRVTETQEAMVTTGALNLTGYSSFVVTAAAGHGVSLRVPPGGTTGITATFDGASVITATDNEGDGVHIDVTGGSANFATLDGEVGLATGATITAGRHGVNVEAGNRAPAAASAGTMLDHVRITNTGSITAGTETATANDAHGIIVHTGGIRTNDCPEGSVMCKGPHVTIVSKEAESMIATTGGHGIFVENSRGIGDVVIDVDGVTAVSGAPADAENRMNQSARIEADGILVTHARPAEQEDARYGLDGGTAGQATLQPVGGVRRNITITAANITGHRAGVHVRGSQGGTGDITVSVSGMIRAMATTQWDGDAIHIDHVEAASGVITVTVGGTLMPGPGVNDCTGTGNTMTNCMGDAIELRNANEHHLVLRPGANVMGRVSSSLTRMSRFELAAEAGQETVSTFDLSHLSGGVNSGNIVNKFQNFSKTGEGVWIVTGAQAEDAGFAAAEVAAGTLRLAGSSQGASGVRCTRIRVSGGECTTVLRPGPDGLAVSAAGTLEIDGDSNRIAGPTGAETNSGVNSGKLINSGTLAFFSGNAGDGFDDEAADVLAVAKYEANGGTLVFNVSLTDGISDRLLVRSQSRDGIVRGAGGPDTVNLRVTGTPAGELARSIDLVDVGDASVGAVDAFRAGVARVGDETHRFTLVRGGVGDWEVVSIAATPIRCVEQSTPGTFVCSGTSGSTEIMETAGGMLTATGEDGFSVAAATGHALRLRVPPSAAASGIAADFTDGTQTVTATDDEGDGIHVDATGAGTSMDADTLEGDISIATGAAITAGRHGVNVVAGSRAPAAASTGAMLEHVRIANTGTITAGTRNDGAGPGTDGDAHGIVVHTGGIMPNSGRGTHVTISSNHADAMITATGGHGVYVGNRRGVGDVVIDVDGITAMAAPGTTAMNRTHDGANIEPDGIHVSHAGLDGDDGGLADVGGTTRDITITAANVTGHRHGIYVRGGRAQHTGNIRVAVSGMIRAMAATQWDGDAVHIDGIGTNADIEVSVSGTLMPGPGNVGESSRPAGDTAAGTWAAVPGDAVELRNGSAQRLILDPGADVRGRITATHSNAVLELRAGAGQEEISTFNLAETVNNGFRLFDKTGGGIWMITGEQPENTQFEVAEVLAGTLRFTGGTGTDPVTLRVDDGKFVDVGEGGTIEIDGAVRFSDDASGREGLFNNGGHVSLATAADDMTGDRLTVGGYTTGGGVVTFNVSLGEKPQSGVGTTCDRRSNNDGMTADGGNAPDYALADCIHVGGMINGGTASASNRDPDTVFLSVPADDIDTLRMSLLTDTDDQTAGMQPGTNSGGILLVNVEDGPTMSEEGAFSGGLAFGGRSLESSMAAYELTFERDAGSGDWEVTEIGDEEVVGCWDNGAAKTAVHSSGATVDNPTRFVCSGMITASSDEVVDDMGNPVFEDHDNDPNTPDRRVTLPFEGRFNIFHLSNGVMRLQPYVGGVPIHVTSTAGFSMDITEPEPDGYGDAMTVIGRGRDNGNGATSISVEFNGDVASSALCDVFMEPCDNRWGDALRIDAGGETDAMGDLMSGSTHSTGPVTVVANGNTTGGRHAINVQNAVAVDSVSITNTGVLKSGGHAISVQTGAVDAMGNDVAGGADVTITSTAVDASISAGDSTVKGRILDSGEPGDITADDGDDANNDVLREFDARCAPPAEADWVAPPACTGAVEAHGIFVDGSDGIGSVTIDVGAVTAAGAESDGIHVAGGRGMRATTIAAAAITAGDRGVHLVTAATATTVAVTAGGAVMSGDHGVFVDHDGVGKLAISTGSTVTSTTQSGIIGLADAANTGGVEITAEGMITTTGGAHGIGANNQGSGAIVITAAGIEAGERGVDLDTGTASGAATINLNGTVTAGMEGVHADHGGTGALTVTASAVTASGGAGIRLNNTGGTGDTIVNANGAVSGTTGIDIDAAGGAVVVNLRGMLAGTGGTAIDLTGGASHRLVLNSGAGVTGDVMSNLPASTLVLNAAGEDTNGGPFDLGTVSGFGALSKTGGGVWALTGAQADGQRFDTADVAAGTLRLEGTDTETVVLRAATATLAPGAGLEVEGEGMLHGDLVNGGTLALGSVAADGDTDDRLTITGSYTEGGTLTLDADFDAVAADRLLVMNGVTGTGATTLNIRATGSITAATIGAMTRVFLVDVTGASADDDFEAGMIYEGSRMLGFTLQHHPVTRPDGGLWTIESVNGIFGPACMEDLRIGGTYVCRGVARMTENPSAISGEQLIVSDEDSFDLVVTDGNAMELTAASGSTGMTVEFTRDILASGTGADAGHGIDVDHDGSGTISLTTAGVVSMAGTGINIDHANDSGGVGMGDGNTMVIVNGAVSGTTGITVNDRGTGAIVVDLRDMVTGTAAAIDLDGGGSHRLRVNPGAGFSGMISSSRNDAVLELAAASGESGMFDLTGLAGGSNFVHLDKTGDGDWELTGAQGANMNEFMSADIADGTLRLNAATLRVADGGDTTITAGGVLGINEESVLHGNLVNEGMLALGSVTMDGDTEDELEIMGAYTRGGTLTLDISLVADSADADQVFVRGGVTGSAMTMMNIRATGTVTDATVRAISEVVLVDVTGTSTDADFTEGKVYLGALVHDFELLHTEKSTGSGGEWTILSINGIGGPACVEDQQTSGTYVCRGIARLTENPGAVAGEPLVVTDESSFDIAVADGSAMELTAAAGSTGMTVTFTQAINATGTGGGHGIDADHDGSGALSLTTAAVTSMSGTGINIDHANNSGGAGMGMDDITVITNGAVSGVTGIDVNDQGSTGDIVVSLGSSVAGTGGTAIDIDGGGSQKIIVNPGASFSGVISSSRNDGILELAAESGERGTFDLTSLLGGSNFADLDKTGDGTWELMGTQTAGANEFFTADVEDGTLRFNASTLRVIEGRDMTIASGAELQVDGDSTLYGNLVNSGMLALGSVMADGDTEDEFTVAGAYTKGGMLTLNINLDENDADADQVFIRGGVTGSATTTMNIRATGAITRESVRAISSVVLVDVTGGTSTDADFVEGLVYLGGRMHDFELLHTAKSPGPGGEWTILSINTTGSVLPACIEDLQISGTYVCRGIARETENPDAIAAEPLIVTDESSFDIAVADGNAMELTAAAGSTGMTVTFTQDIAATGTDGGHGIDADHDGSGALSLTTAGVSSVAGTAIRVDHANNSGGPGTGMDDITVTANGAVIGMTGIAVTDQGSMGDITVSLRDSVTGTGGTAIDLDGGGSQRIVLNPGASFSGVISSSRNDGILELAADSGRSGTFDLTSLVGGSSFVDFDKTGDGTWELTGAQAAGANEFASADIADGILRFNVATLHLAAGGDMTIAPDATLEVDGTGMLNGDLVNSGTLALGSTLSDGDTDDEFTVTGSYTKGGTLTLNAVLDATDADADQVFIQGGVVTGSATTTINIRATGSVNRRTVHAISSVVLVDVTGGASTDADFDEGHVFIGSMMHDFELLHTAKTPGPGGEWTILSIDGTGSSRPACVEDLQISGTYVCRGTARETENPDAIAGEPLVVTDESSFDIDVADGNAMELTAAAGSTGMRVTFTQDIAASGTSGGHGIDADHDGFGALSLTTAGVTSRSGTGINVDHANNTGGAGRGASDTTLVANGAVSGTTGIAVNDQGTRGAIVVSIGGSVTGTGGTAIDLDGGGSQRIVVNPGASFNGLISSSRNDGILELAAESGQSGTFNLTSLRRGSNFVHFDKSGGGTWQLNGAQAAGANEFISADIEAGTLRLNAATLRLTAGSDMTIASGAALEIDGTSMLHGDLVNNGTLALGSTTSDGDTGDEFTITGSYTKGGTLTINAALDVAAPAADQVFIQGGVTGGATTTINIRATGSITNETVAAISDVVLVDVTGGASRDIDFEDGHVFIGSMMHEFALQHTAKTPGPGGEWTILSINGVGGTPTGPTGPDPMGPDPMGPDPMGPDPMRPIVPPAQVNPSVPTIESYATSLALLSRLSSLHDRIGDRQWLNGAETGMWGRVDGYAGQFQPKRTLGMSEMEMLNSRASFGLEFPIRRNENLTVGASASLFNTNTDVTSVHGNGEIKLRGYTLGGTATWITDDGFYVDGQVQVAGFDSDLVAPTPDAQGPLGHVVKDSTGSSMSASGEIGYKFELNDITLIPQGQVVWSNVEFEDFVDPTSAAISLEDGDTLVGRLGISVEQRYTGDRQGSLYGNADLLMPFDGETAANMAGETLASELGGISFDVGAGFSVELTDQRSIFGELSTTQGESVEEYRASVGFRFGF